MIVTKPVSKPPAITAAQTTQAHCNGHAEEMFVPLGSRALSCPQPRQQ
jgi:hypothetical protein